ncbi:MAG: ABC transporter substrate-binding protein [Ardenticatenia bacterium]|nr:ABC transporter substrate-binding protein [Ardenticatenia bacterium]
MNPSFPRLVSLEPSITATLLALNRHHLLVAGSEHDRRLLGDQVAHLPVVPSTWAVRAADVLQFHPDLVIASVPFREQSLAELLKAGLHVLSLYPRDLASVYQTIRLLAALTDARKAGEQIVADMQATFEHLRTLTAHRPPTRVYVETWPRPLISAPLWVAELVEIVGGRFVPPGPGRQVTEDEVITADPEVIVVAWPGVDNPPLERVYARPGWEDVAAIRNRRVVAVNEIVLNAPGPNLVHAAHLLADVIAPEEGSDIEKIHHT